MSFQQAPATDILKLKVPLGIGTLQWGTTPIDQSMINAKGVISESEAARIVHAFTQAGVTLWDTAEGYGGGTSEKRLGRLLAGVSSSKTKNVQEDKPLLMTKFLPVPWRGFHWQFEQAVRASCRRLQTSKIDIYLLHSPVHWRPLEYWIESAARCKAKGLLESVGLSNCNAGQVRRAVQAGTQFGVDVVVNQVHYSLLDYNSDNLQEMEATCRALGVAIVGFSPIGQGLLTDTLTPDKWQSNRPAKMLRLQWGDLNALRACLKRLAHQYEKSMAQVAINWCICHNVIPLVGCRTYQQAQDTIGALGWKLKADDVQELDRLALSRSTLDSPGWRRMIFVSLFGIVMIVCRFCDYVGFGMVQQAKL